jgi:hypothetical protein
MLQTFMAPDDAFMGASTTLFAGASEPMSKLHVLAGAGANFTVVIHQATPAGNNSAGFPWSAILIAAGRNVSVLTVGSGPGQITQAEMDGIAAGTIIELVSGVTELPTWTNATIRNAEIDAQAAVMMSSQLAKLSQEFKWYGAERA